MSTVTTPRKPAFEIKESQHSKITSYTHSLYLNGKLFTDELYRMKNSGDWWYDGYVEPDMDVFSSILLCDFPDTLSFSFYLDNAVSFYCLDRVRKEGDEVVFDFNFSFDQIDTSENINTAIATLYWLSLLQGEDELFEIDPIDGNIDIPVSLVFNKSETFGEVFKRAIAVIEDITKKAKAMRKKNKTEILKNES